MKRKKLDARDVEDFAAQWSGALAKAVYARQQYLEECAAKLEAIQEILK